MYESIVFHLAFIWKLVNSCTHNKCVRNVASLEYGLYVNFCVVSINSLAVNNLGIWEIALSLRTKKKGIVQQQTKIGQQFFRQHATTAHNQFFFLKSWYYSTKTKILRADESIYFKYIILQSLKIVWELYIKQISFGHV